MSNTNFKTNPPLRKKNALDNRKLNLSTPCPTAPDKTSALIWGVYGNHPRISVYTNDPNDVGEEKEYGRIQARLDSPTFFAFIELLEHIAKTKGEFSRKIKNLNYVWKDGQRAEEATVVSNLEAGRDKEGVIWVAITALDRPVIRFPIINSDYHHWCNVDNTPVSKEEASEFYTLGYCNLLRNFYGNILVSEYVDDAPRNGSTVRPVETITPVKQKPYGVEGFEEDIPY